MFMQLVIENSIFHALYSFDKVSTIFIKGDSLALVKF